MKPQKSHNHHKESRSPIRKPTGRSMRKSQCARIKGNRMPQPKIRTSTRVLNKIKEGTMAFVLLLIVLQPFLIGLNQESYHGDESLHISRGITSIGLILRRDFGADAWGYITPANVIMGVGSWLSGIRSGQWDFNVRPPDQVLLSARIPVAILGAISCIVLFYIGRALGGFGTGLFASLLLAFNPLWLMSSRQAMCDTPSAFFSIISVFLFYYGVKRKNLKGKAYVFIALSGLTTGLAVGSKLLAGVTFTTIAIYLLITIINEYDIDRTISLSQSGREALLGLFIFVMSSLVAFVACRPFFWSPYHIRGYLEFNVNAPEFLSSQFSTTNVPTVPGDRLAAAAGITDFVLWPIYMPNPLRHFPTCLTWLNLSNYPLPSYSTLAASAFFFVGLAYLGLKVTKKKLSQIETLSLMWFVIAFVGLSLWIPVLWNRYVVQLIPPLVLIEAEGLSYLLRGTSRKMGYLFAGAALTTHIGSILMGFPEYYLFNLQSLFTNIIGLTLTAAFIVSTFCITISRIYLRRKYQKSGREEHQKN